MKQTIKNLFRINWWATLRLNFGLLPWCDARRLPIIVYGKLRMETCGGALQLPTHAPRATVVIGSHHETYVASGGRAQLSLHGTWKVEGRICIGVDSCLYIGQGATLTTGGGCFIARDSQIHCFHQISIGQGVKAGEVYITDSAAHTIVRGGNPSPMLGEVKVGNRCYLGFRTMLLKGCVLPPDSVVGSGAVCTRDYSTQGTSGLFLTGCPATIKEREVKTID